MTKTTISRWNPKLFFSFNIYEKEKRKTLEAIHTTIAESIKDIQSTIKVNSRLLRRDLNFQDTKTWKPACIEEVMSKVPVQSKVKRIKLLNRRRLNLFDRNFIKFGAGLPDLIFKIKFFKFSCSLRGESFILGAIY